MNRSLRLLMLLSSTRKYSVSEISERLEITERTVYRYLNTIEDSGFIVERDSGYYRLLQTDSNTKSIRNLLHFSEEEAYTLYRALLQIGVYEHYGNKIIKKPHTLYDFKALRSLRNSDNLTKINVLSKAINNDLAVILRQYYSSNSDNIEDRLVEPFEIMSDYEAIWCFDLRDKQVKQFKISRITEVDLTTEKIKYKDHHNAPFTDAFRMSAERSIAQVKATLSLKAYNLLREEYPTAYEYTKSSGDGCCYMLDIPIADFNGIGRFVLGLPEDIQIQHPQEFIDFLNEKKKIIY